jgi:uncharacterized protein (TIGR03435 family)
MLLQLNHGSIIVTAAKQRNGHLYVRTKDVTVSVVGTVFFVNAEEAGSRVAVIEGEVHMQQGRTEKKLLPGEQVATNPIMPAVPLIEEIQWSHNAVAHLALLQQSVALPSQAKPNATVEPVPLQFEVASIRPPGYPRTARFACRGVDGTVELRGNLVSAFANATYKGQVLEGGLVVPTGRCIGQPDILDLIAIAYGIPRRDVSGGPEWARARIGSGAVQRFSIEAKAEDVKNVTKEQLRQMLQSLLADRFKFKFHWAPRESEGYALLVAKGGSKLKEGSGEELPPEAGGSIGPGGADTVLKGKSRLQSLADQLSWLLNLPVLNRTDLTGMYDYTLTLHQPPPTAGGQRGDAGGGGDGYDPPLSTALQQQLGLRLESQKVQLDTIVIDQVDKPSEN